MSSNKQILSQNVEKKLIFSFFSTKPKCLNFTIIQILAMFASNSKCHYPPIFRRFPISISISICNRRLRQITKVTRQMTMVTRHSILVTRQTTMVKRQTTRHTLNIAMRQTALVTCQKTLVTRHTSNGTGHPPHVTRQTFIRR